MSAAIYLVTKKEVVGLPVIDGKRLSLALDDLDFLAQKLDLELPSSFLHVTKEELEDVIASAGVDMMDLMIPETEWFDAENLLETVFALRVHLERHPEAMLHSASVLPDLRALELALELCEAREISVRLTIDI